ncbi:MAG: C4-dicarboxylate ABC transporter, partial [Proteobacteria bacterium]|nr:C4-dicarboxylate ABC transporter [Pseudomonadota bacterium]
MAGISVVEFIPLLFFAVVCLALMAGYPVALTLAGVSLLSAAVGSWFGGFDTAFVALIPNRIYGILV